jgi:hypothetical protein
MAASVEPADVYSRRDLHLPSVDSSTIVAVTQSQACQKTLAAFNTTIPGVSPAPAKIYVVTYGTIYVAMYPVSDVNFWPAAVIDSKYKVLAKFAL